MENRACLRGPTRQNSAWQKKSGRFAGNDGFGEEEGLSHDPSTAARERRGPSVGMTSVGKARTSLGPLRLPVAGRLGMTSGGWGRDISDQISAIRKQRKQRKGGPTAEGVSYRKRCWRRRGRRKTTKRAAMPRKEPSGNWYWEAMMRRSELALPWPRPRRAARAARSRFQPMR